MMELILALLLGFLVGFLSAGYLHYKRCRKQGMTRVQAVAATFGLA